jgi:hypothetical protein
VSTTGLPTFSELLAGLARRGLQPEVRDGRLGLRGDKSKVDVVVRVACLWYADELRALVAGRSSGHVVAVCDACGEWTFTHRSKTPPCRMTPGCKGRHRPMDGGSASEQRNHGTSSPTRNHGAQFAPALLDALPVEWFDKNDRVLDPFAGVGQRLGSWCDLHGFTFHGFDIEEWPDHDPRVGWGDATDPACYPPGRWRVVTSPTYGNGCNDHFTPKDPNRDDNTYRTWLGRDLHPHNSGRYTVRNGGWKEQRYWNIERQAVAIWAERGFDALVNLKDFPYHHGTYPLVARWRQLLAEYGYTVADPVQVPTPGLRRGTNTDTCLDYEVWLHAVRPSP